MNLIINEQENTFRVTSLDFILDTEKLYVDFEVTDHFLKHSHFYILNKNKDGIEFSQSMFDSYNNENRKQEIFKELESLDLKSIRPLAENDTQRLEDIENQKVSLREKLQGL